MGKYRVVVSDARHASYDIERERLKAIDADLEIRNCVTAEDVAAQCADADGILLDMAPMNAAAISGLKRCRIINRYGVGCDNVDVKAANDAGIVVTNVPDYCAEDVSDHALALLMACLRDVARRDRMVRQGAWNLQRTSFRLQGKVLGVLGFGRIARALVRKCAGFALSKVMAYDPYVPAEVCEAAGVVKASLEDVLREADFLSLHMPVTPETTGMLNREALALMKPTAIVVNTGRGPLIDDGAMVEALQNRRILCAGLDTHTHEPLPAWSPYLGLDNVILTDHTAYSTVEGVEELKTKSAQNIVDVLLGRTPRYAVKPLSFEI